MKVLIFTLTACLLTETVYSFLIDDLNNYDWYNEEDNHIPQGHVRSKRQTPGTTSICVPAGTCVTVANGTTPGGGVIDPRIVTNGTVVPTTAPTTCPAGQELCIGLAGGARCGIRFISNVSTANGNVVAPGAYPWQAYILNQTGYTGSGVLLDSYHVLTAAHKVNLNVNSPGNIRVYMGVYNPTVLTQTQLRFGASVTLHPQFSATTLRNDIAIVRLSAPIALGYQNNIGTGCIPAATASFVGRTCVVAGWGRTAFTINDAPTNPQRQVFLPIVSYNDCRTSMLRADVLGTNTDTYLDPNGEICAGGQLNADACTSDGGAPLMCQDANGQYVIAGLVIWGKSCGRQGVYGVYVDVPKYAAWITATINTLNG